MPRKRRKEKPPLRTTVPTQKALAEVLGVHENTVGWWKRDGMPRNSDGSCDIVAVYAWAKLKGLDPGLPDDANLAKLCLAAARGRGAATAPATAKVSEELIQVGAQFGVETPHEFDLDEDDRLLAWQRWASTIDSLIGIRAQRRELVPRSELRPYMQQLAAGAHAHDADLPARVAALLAPHKLDDQVLEAVREAVRQARREQREALARDANTYALRCLRGPAGAEVAP